MASKGVRLWAPLSLSLSLSLPLSLSLALACGSSPTASDGTSPQVRIDAPAAGATVGGQVSIDVTATDNFGVDRVRFLLDGNLLQEVFTAPYHAVWNTSQLANGSVHTIRIEALDVARNRGTTQIQVTVQNGPQ